jgi:hypothetical protein
MKTLAIAAGVLALAMGTHELAAQQPGGGPPYMSQMAQQHMRTMDSMNVRLDTLVARMNRTTGNKKIAAMADVINELVAQRHVMREQMRGMMESRRNMMPGMGRPAPADTGR